jgi:hypothetical protein
VGGSSRLAIQLGGWLFSWVADCSAERLAVQLGGWLVLRTYIKESHPSSPLLPLLVH